MISLPPWLRPSFAARKSPSVPRLRGIEVDIRARPVITARFFDFATYEIGPHIEALLSLVSEGPCGIVYDLRRARSLRPDEYGHFADTFRNERELLRMNCRGGAIITDSATMRGIVAAVTWVVPPPFPLRLFSLEEDAISWLNERLEDGTGSSTPPRKAVG